MKEEITEYQIPCLNKEQEKKAKEISQLLSGLNYSEIMLIIDAVKEEVRDNCKLVFADS